MNNKLPNLLLVVLFLIFIFGFGTYSFFKSDTDISYWENRSLAQKPILTLEAIKNGSYAQNFENYFIDQFPFRDNFVLSYIKYQQITNQTFIQGYFIDSDNYAYPKPLETLPIESINKSANSINELANFTQNIGSDFYFYYMPNRVVVLHDNYPSFLKGELRLEAKNLLYDQLDNTLLYKFDINDYYINNYSKEELKSFYYQTDHHWNTNGLIIGYDFIINHLKKTIKNFKEIPNQYFKNSSLDFKDKFLGSYNRQIFNVINDHNDNTDFYESNSLNLKALKIYNGPVIKPNEVTYDRIYQTELNSSTESVTYAGIFTTDYRELNFVYPLAPNDMKVLVIKDSYTNAISLLLAENFTQTTFYDVRHNQDRSLYDFIEEGNYDLVLFLNSDVSFSGNNFNFKGEQ